MGCGRNAGTVGIIPKRRGLGGLLQRLELEIESAAFHDSGKIFQRFGSYKNLLSVLCCRRELLFEQVRYSTIF